VLEAVHEAALATLQQRYPERPPVLAGKSMGGRMSSYLAAAGADCRALVFYGYPLHPAGKPEKLRVEHFPTLAQPALFLQGTRDALCDLELLRPHLETYGGRPTLEIVEEADHDFAVPRRTGRSREEVLAELVERTTAWLTATLTS
jgi:predicted alpha/beta-hydrolase family hydrolase